MNGVFWVDEGGTYDVHTVDDTTYVTGANTRVTYRSTEHGLAITGKERRQVARGKSASPFRVVGSRAIFILDTGEGLDTLTGVWAPRAAA